MTFTADQIAIAGALVSAVSAAVAVIAIYVPWRNTSDAALFGEAVLALERAFRALNASQQEGNRPAPDRLNWLTAVKVSTG